MSPHEKIKIGILYGGRSGEHEVSLESAASVLKHLNHDKYEVIPISIDPKGVWRVNDLSLFKGIGKSLPISTSQPEVLLNPYPTAYGGLLQPVMGSANVSKRVPLDVVFPLMHGPLCEDGSIQGLMELADVPYVGPGVLSSAISMDKVIAKILVEAAGIEVVPYLYVKKSEWERSPSETSSKAFDVLGSPLFVKPANLGSSVGISKVGNWQELLKGVEDAFRYDRKVLFEKALDVREIELAVLESPSSMGQSLVSIPGEVVPHAEFYTYDAKYKDENGAELVIPALLGDDQKTEAQDIATRVFDILDIEGMARVDLFLERSSGKYYFNELNTIPGFTEISMFPKLWEKSGISYSDLLDTLIRLALIRHKDKKKIDRSYSLNET